MKRLILTGIILFSAAMAHANAPEIQDDSIPAITPLFPPVIVDNSLPVNEDGEMIIPDLSEMGLPITQTPQLRSGTAYKVGTPVTENSVSPQGEALWKMFFDTPKGVGGLTPQIGLAYSSQNGNSLAGWGVGIMGISCITRGLKTACYDSTVRGVKYDSGDAFFLDGQRMLLSEGTEGTSGAVYVLEGDPYTTVSVTSSNSTTGPLAFEVKTTDGHVFQYGATADARLTFTDGVGTQRVHSWYVNREEDPNGNYIEFAYMQDHLTVYPETISYGKNKHTGTGADNYIRFTYTGVYSGTLRTFLIGGVQGGIYKCLSRVRTMTGTSVYRDYTLEYNPFSDGTSRKYERLANVICKNGAGEQMRPVTLEWNTIGAPAPVMGSLAVSTDDPDPNVEELDSVLLSADFNGDGLADIVRVSNCKRYTGVNQYETHTYVYVHRSHISDTDSVTYLPPIIFDLGSQFISDDLKMLIGAHTMADIDGDGLNDLVIPYYVNVSSILNRIHFACMRGKNNKGGSTSVDLFMLNLTAATEMPPFVNGDLDGNGMDDMVCLENKKSGGYYSLQISFSLPDNARYPASIPLTLPQNPKRLFASDFNGDGLTDLIALYDGGHKVFFNNGGSSLSAVFSDTNSLTGTSFGATWRVEQGDFNGDGYTDFVYVGKNSSLYCFALNNGDGTFAVSTAISYDIHDETTKKDDECFSLHPIDIDHDGLTDLVVAKAFFSSGNFTHTTVGWLLSDGSSLSQTRRVYSYLSKEESSDCNIMIADFDGDGWPELANNGADWSGNASSSGDGSHIRVYHTSGFTPSSGRMASATDALGAVTSFSYGASSSPAINTHIYGDSVTYPLSNCHTPIVLVANMVKNDGMTGNHSLTYRYRGLTAHLQGKGLLGFRDFAERDGSTGMTVQKGTVRFNTSYYVPSITYSVTSMGYDRDSTATSFSIAPHGESKYVSFPASSRRFDMDGNQTTETYSYSHTDGYLIQKRTEYGSSSMFRQEKYLSYVKRGGRWLPQSVETKQKHAHDANVGCTEVSYTYDASGNILSKVEYPGDAMQLTTVLTYDSYGNILSYSRAGAGVDSVTSYNVYDATGRFATRKYRSHDAGDRLFTYDLWGNMLTSSDVTVPAHPLVTAYTLDAWGDVVSSTSPEGVTTAYTSGWGGSSYTAYYLLEECPGKAPVKTWFDLKGRVCQKESRGPYNVNVVQQTVLNGWGTLSQSIQRTGTRVTIEQTDYDHRGRPSQSFRTGYGYTYYGYGNRSRTVTHDGRTFTAAYDAWGNILESCDPASSITYTYGSDGLPSEVESDGKTMCMEYDTAGNRTRLDDPDAGVCTSTFTADGKLLSRTDGRGMVTQNSYDAHGRLVRTACDTLVTTYTYGTSGNGKLRLVREQTGSMADEYTYDSYGRVTLDMRTFDGGATSGHTYAYDSVGHVSQHIYPSGLSVSYTYDGNGYMHTMSCNGAQVWQTLSFDGWNMAESFGATTVTSKLTQAGQLAERYVQVSGSTEKLYRMAFSWDATRGNLSSRTGIAGTGVVETFVYDALDRLTSVSTGGQGTMAMTYDDDGSILSKTGLGNYTYSQTHPHAVAGVENTGYMITSSSQQVSYNPWGKASHIEEGIYTQELAYGPDRQRWKVTDRQNGQATSIRYHHGDYEWRNENGQVRQYHYLDNGVMVMKVGNNNYWYYYMLTDNVGSVVRVITGDGSTAFAVSYDAWGKPTVTTNQISYRRGFGGHEMLPEYRLVNMNGRMYDYTLGRFLSPDNYVQEPENSQSFNRYSYCLNNPLKYTDPDGDIWGLSIATGFLKGVVKFVSGRGKWYSPFYMAYKNGINELKLTWGWFKGSPKQILSRFTLELPQTAIGHYYSLSRLTLNNIDKVRYFEGATYVINYAGNNKGATLGSFININTTDKIPLDKNGHFAPYKSALFAHEYGHYIQSQRTGWGYLVSHGLPSLRSAIINNKKYAIINGKEYPRHHLYWTEIDANTKAADYFIRKGYLEEWTFDVYPTN